MTYSRSQTQFSVLVAEIHRFVRRDKRRLSALPLALAGCALPIPFFARQKPESRVQSILIRQRFRGEADDNGIGRFVGRGGGKV